MPGSRSKSEKHDAAKQLRRDPYEVLGISRNSTDQDIKTAYRKMALKYVENFLSKLGNLEFSSQVVENLNDLPSYC